MSQQQAKGIPRRPRRVFSYTVEARISLGGGEPDVRTFYCAGFTREQAIADAKEQLGEPQIGEGQSLTWTIRQAGEYAPEQSAEWNDWLRKTASEEAGEPSEPRQPETPESAPVHQHENGRVPQLVGA